MKKIERMELLKPVGIWIRVSTENQAKGDSPEHHEQRARYYAQAREWDVVEVYHLEAVSGKSVLDHPEAKRMLKDVQRGRISGLIFSKLARLARNTRELLELADIFRSLDADLISLQESIDTSTPAGRLFYTMIAAMAQWEREEIADRVSASISIRAQLGKPLNGRAPYGYVWKDKKLIPHPKEAPVRKLMYDLFLEHRRKKTVARLLNEAGYRTRDGSLFSDTTVGRLIEDPTAKGRHRANFTKRMGPDKPWVPKPESEWVWKDVEPIVSEEVWDQCNQLLADRQTKQKRPGKRAVHLFSGITFCACGKKMYVPTNTPKYVCQTCRRKIPIVDLEAVYYEQIKGFFLSREQIEGYLVKAVQNMEEKEELLRVSQTGYEQVQAEMERVYGLYRDGQLSNEGFGRLYRPLEERLSQLENEIPRLQAEADIVKINHLSSDRILGEAQELYTGWPRLTRQEKQRVVESITEKIVVGQDEIAVSLCYSPSSEEMTKEQRRL